MNNISLHGNPLCWIGENEIIDVLNGKTYLKINNEVITMSVYGVEVTKPYEWFELMGKLDIKLPIGHYGRIKDIEISEFGHVYSEKYRYCVQAKEPIIIKQSLGLEIKEYALILGLNVGGYEFLAIDKDWNLIDLKTNTIIRSNNGNVLLDLGEYKQFTIDRDAFYVHRLMAAAWVYNNDPKHRYQVNHKDLNKQNNHPDNLEWVTHRENIQHLYSNPENTLDFTLGNKCRIRHIKTGDIKEFYTINDMCKFLGTASRSTASYLSTSLGYTQNDYEIRMDTDKRPWYYEDNNTSKAPLWAKTKWDVYDNDVLINTYYTLHDICKHFSRDRHVPVSILVNELKITKPNIKIVETAIRKLGPYEAYCLKTNEVFKRDSIADLIKITGISDTAIGTRIRELKSKQPAGDWLFRYASKEPWDIDNLDTVEPRLAKRIKVTNLETQESITYDSISKAIEGTPNISKKTFKKKLRANQAFNGYKAVYVD